MKLPPEFIARVDDSLALGGAPTSSTDGLGEIATVALHLAKGDRGMARALMLKDFEHWLATTGRIGSSYSFQAYPEFRKGRRRTGLFGALAWTYLLPMRNHAVRRHA